MRALDALIAIAERELRRAWRRSRDARAAIGEMRRVLEDARRGRR